MARWRNQPRPPPGERLRSRHVLQIMVTMVTFTPKNIISNADIQGKNYVKIKSIIKVCTRVLHGPVLVSWAGPAPSLGPGLNDILRAGCGPETCWASNHIWWTGLVLNFRPVQGPSLYMKIQYSDCLEDFCVNQ